MASIGNKLMAQTTTCTGPSLVNVSVPLMIIVVLIFERKDFRQILVSNAVEET